MTSPRSEIRAALAGARHEKDRSSRRYLPGMQPRMETKPGSFHGGVVRIRAKRPKIAHCGDESRKGSLRNPFMGKGLD
jgi:hypothetical protein